MLQHDGELSIGNGDAIGPGNLLELVRRLQPLRVRRALRLPFTLLLGDASLSLLLVLLLQLQDLLHLRSAQQAVLLLELDTPLLEFVVARGRLLKRPQLLVQCFLLLRSTVATSPRVNPRIAGATLAS